MIPQSSYIKIFGWLALGTAVLLTAHYSYVYFGYGIVAAFLVLIPPAVSWWQAGRSRENLLAQTPEVIASLSVVALISLTGPSGGQPIFSPLGQIGLAVGYVVFAASLHYARLAARRPLLVAGISQSLGTSALFLVATFWHWLPAVILILIWGLSFAAAYWYLEHHEERASLILATTWALIVTEAAWVFTVWLVNYIEVGGLVVIPQAALVVLGLGYCLAGIYQSHNRKRLSQRRLIEYMVITGILLAIIVAGTR